MEQIFRFFVQRFVVFLSLFCVFGGNLQAEDFYKNEEISKTVYVGDSFTINPWGTLKTLVRSSFFECSSTSCYATGTSIDAFTINESSRTKTTIFQNSGFGEGYYCTYSIKALKTGTYTIKANAYAQFKLEYATYNCTYKITVKEKPKVVSISIPSTKSLEVGKTYTFSPVISETGATTTLKWTSSKTAVATVTSAGKVTAVAPGKTTIKCTASNGVYAQCTLTVTPIYVKGITLNSNEVEIFEGDQYALKATIAPTNATNKEVVWTSSNNAVAIVGTTGKVIGVAEGYAFVTATAKDGSGKTGECLVHVKKKPIKVSSIVVSPASVRVQTGATVKLAATILPANATDSSLSWKSSDTSVATVGKDGLVTAVSDGTVTITATTNDGSNISSSCKITIDPTVGKLAKIVAAILNGTATMADLKAAIEKALGK